MSRETYSYDVPDMCLDFKDMNDDRSINIDAWFDARSAALMTPTAEMGTSGIQPKALPSRSKLPCAVVSPMMKSDGKENDNQEVEMPNEVPPNVVRSMEEWHPTRQENAPPPRRSNHRENLGEIDLNINVLPENAQAPVTPDAHKTRGPSAKGKSTEELELEKMQQLQQEVAELRRKNEESLKVAIAGPGPSRPLKPQLTNPKTPCLETKRRMRPPTCKSTAELENEEITKLQQYRFKAQELNHRILEGGPLLPKKPPMKELTKPVGFNLEIEKRIQERETKKVQEEEPFEFHSRPCPTRILEDVPKFKAHPLPQFDHINLPEKKVKSPTKPEPFQLAIDARGAVRQEMWQHQ
ncbi:hypothetical protein L345_15622, partial [Ophiophagus hannah]